MKAAERLKQHIDKHYAGNVQSFARKHGFDGSEISRIVRGERGNRMSVKLAAQLEKACKGKRPEIPIKLWAEES